MRSEQILKIILENPNLKEKYWPDINVDEVNTNTLLQSTNPYLKALYYLLTETNKTRLRGMTNNVLNTFGL